MGCIWQIPDKFEMNRESPLSFIELGDDRVSTILFKEKKYDLIIEDSELIDGVKHENHGLFDWYKFSYYISKGEPATEVVVISSMDKHIAFLDVSERDLKIISSKCL